MRKSRTLSGFEYDKDTGQITYDGCVVGHSAGNSGRYLSVSIDGKKILCHRLAWYLYHGEWPSKDIDHIDGDPRNNRINNLRLATDSENLRNQRKIKGYHKVGKRWRAMYSQDNKMQHIGMYDSPQEARTAYLKATEGK